MTERLNPNQTRATESDTETKTDPKGDGLGIRAENLPVDEGDSGGSDTGGGGGTKTGLDADEVQTDQETPTSGSNAEKSRKMALGGN